MKTIIVILLALLTLMTVIAVKNSQPLTCDNTRLDEQTHQQICEVYIR